MDKVYVVYVSGKSEWIKDLGVIDTSIFKDKNFGDKINILDFEFLIVKPTLEDILANIERGPQIVNKKDLGTMIFKSGINENSNVVEIGIGSGFLTVSILYYLKSGKLTSYDISEKIAKNVLENLKRFGLERNWFYKIRDFSEGIDEKDIDAIFLDIPEPWNGLEKLKGKLKKGATIVIYLPNITQVNEMVNSLKKENFSSIEILETIERHWISGFRELRPENYGILHTSFIIFARNL